MDKYKGRSGFFIKKFLIGPEFNQNQWRVTWDAIKKDVWNFEGKPVVLTPTLDHPRVDKQENYKVGEIIDVQLDELKQIATEVSQIYDKRAQKLIKQKKVRFGSPTVLKYSDETIDETPLGNGRIRSVLHRFIPAHDAIVEEPAYGKQVDYIPAICNGTGAGCALKLQAVSASAEPDNLVEKIIKREHELLGEPPDEKEKKIHRQLVEEFASEVNSDNVNQLTIVPFVRKVLKANFNHKSLGQMIEYSKKTRQGADNSCISRKISILADEHKDWSHDKIIAVAYSYCGDKEAQITKIILGELTPEILDVHEKIRKDNDKKEALAASIAKLEGKLKGPYAAADDPDIEGWFTVHGNHIPIHKGESREEALKNFLDSKGSGAKLTSGESKLSKSLSKSYPNLKSSFVEQQVALSKTFRPKIEKINQKWQGILKKDLPGSPKVTGRTKDIASMIGKLSRKPKYKSIKDLQDASGLRAEYESITDVKTARDFVKKNYEIVEEDDYIEKPKFDGYRSYHAIIKDESGQEQELQIRTLNETKWADWAHNWYKPPDEKMEAFYTSNKDKVDQYSLDMAQYFADVDQGRNPKKPDCPKEIAHVELCL